MLRVRENRGLAPASHRFGLSSLFGVVCGVIAAFFFPWQMAELIAFDAAALVQLAWVWSTIARLDGEQTSAIATPEDNSPAVTNVVVFTAALMSLIGVALALVKAKSVQPSVEVALTILAVGTVVVAWWTVHTTFVLRYAHLYYRGEDGGVDFGDDTLPDYRDFLYLALTVGMTFQVSDTDITDRSIRRQITHHALLSFVFGTVIIGLTINVTAGFIR
jgi:uncharacterized membrane protein